MKKKNTAVKDWWDKLPLSVQKSIIKAEKQLDEGKGIPHEVVMKKYSKYFTTQSKK